MQCGSLATPTDERVKRPLRKKVSHAPHATYPYFHSTHYSRNDVERNQSSIIIELSPDDARRVLEIRDLSGHPRFYGSFYGTWELVNDLADKVERAQRDAQVCGDLEVRFFDTPDHDDRYDVADAVGILRNPGDDPDDNAASVGPSGSGPSGDGFTARQLHRVDL